MKRYNLFAALNQKDDPDAVIYRCGYYIVNKHTNQSITGEEKDIFYTILQNALLKVIVIQNGDTEYFNIYKMRDLTDEQISNINTFALDREDIQEEDLEQVMNIESFDPLRPETWTLKGRENVDWD